VRIKPGAFDKAMMISKQTARLLRKLDVVFVDDSQTMISIGKKVLGSMGVRAFRSASDGKKALKMLTGWPAGLVITDLEMGPMNGLDLTRAIRSGVGGIDPRTPVIALTGNAESKTVKAALLAGVNGFLVKPIDPETVMRRIEKVITTKVIYQLKGDHYCINPKANGDEPGNLVYDGLLTPDAALGPNKVEKQADKGDEDEVWVID
jgi:two-component system, chemotaxis family, chemotaxis protein CheY